MNINVWKNVAVSLQSAVAAAKTVTAISNANPAIASSVAHGFVKGDVVILSTSGMPSLNSAVVRVGTVTADSFALEGIDGSGIGQFGSVTASKVTLGTSVGTFGDVSPSGGERADIQVPLIHNDEITVIPGAAAAKAFGFNSLWDPADAGLLALRAADKSGNLIAVQFSWGAGRPVVLFAAYVSCSLMPGGSAQDRVTTAVSLKLGGPMQVYAV